MIPQQKSTHVLVDWKGESLLDFTIDWNYEKGYVDISMPEYIQNTLKKLLYDTGAFPYYSPYEPTASNWTNKGERQYAQHPYTSPFRNKTEMKYVQIVVYCFLYYARALDSTMLPVLNQIASQHAQPTTHIVKKV